MKKYVNVGRTGVFGGLFGNPVKERTVSKQYRIHFKKVMISNPEKVEWLRQQISEGVPLFCPGCGFDSPTCHARIIEQELELASI